MQSGLNKQIKDEPGLVSGLNELASAYDVILCDVWGVIHNGLAYFPAAADALTRFRAKGGKVVLITNAPRPRQVVVEQLDGFGVPRSAYDGLVTSGDVTLSLIRESNLSRLIHIGAQRDRVLFDLLERDGRAIELAGVDDAEIAVCTGLFDENLYDLADYEPLLAAMRARDLTFICANPDIVVHVGDELMYCAGALAERYEALGGRVNQAGKPFSSIYAEAFTIAAALMKDKLERRRILAIGDAMHTDMKGAQNEKLDALFVTSGIHREELQGMAQGNVLDAAAVRQFAEAIGFIPMAAIPELVW